MNGKSKPCSELKVHCTPRALKPSDSPTLARLSRVAPSVVTLAMSLNLPSVIDMPKCLHIIARQAAPQSVSSACSISGNRCITFSPKPGLELKSMENGRLLRSASFFCLAVSLSACSIFFSRDSRACLLRSRTKLNVFSGMTSRIVSVSAVADANWPHRAMPPVRQRSHHGSRWQ